MTDNELKELVASLAVSQKEVSDEIAISQKGTFDNIANLKRETSREIEEVKRKISDLGWGYLHEGVAIASLGEILIETFEIHTIMQRLGKRMDGESIEIDVFGYENSPINTAVVVEIKSHLREDAVEQIENTMTNFPKFFPDHADKKLYGIIACVHAPENIKNILRKKGIYLAVLHDDIFKLYPFKDFTPKDFSQQ